MRYVPSARIMRGPWGWLPMRPQYGKALTPPPAATRPAAEGHRRDEINAACLEALKRIQAGFGAVVKKWPQALSHLGRGSIDEKDLSVHFPLTDARYRIIHNLPGRGWTAPPPPFDGLGVQFISPLPDQDRRAERLRPVLLFVRVGVTWSWAWGNKEFPPGAQADVNRLVLESVGKLAALENAAIARALAGRGKGPFVLRGREGIELTIHPGKPRPGAGGPLLELRQTNRGDAPAAVLPGPCEVILDGKLWLGPAPADAQPMLPSAGGTKDPFVRLKPGESRAVWRLALAGLPPGRHTVRVACWHPHTGWLDIRPMAGDAPPVYRRVPSAWTGVVVSNELEVRVPPSPGPGGPAPALEATAAKLAAEVGGRWAVDLHNAFPRDVKIIRGRIDAAPGKALVRYDVFPFGPEDKARRGTVLRIYGKAKTARILGASAECIVVELPAEGADTQRVSAAVVKALRLKPLEPAASAPAQKIDLAKTATYRSGPWEYRLVVTALGTRSEGRRGMLTCAGKALPEPGMNDYYRTPWGNIYWVGDPNMISGDHCWMPRPSRIIARKGRLLTPPPAATRPAGVQPDYEMGKRFAKVLTQAGHGLYRAGRGLVKKGRAAVPGLVALVEKGDALIKPGQSLRQWEYAAFLLGDIGDARAAPFLAARLTDPRARSFYVVRPMGQLRVRQAVPTCCAG